MVEQAQFKPKSGAPRTNQDRFEQTRAALMTSAKDLFAERGYAGANTTDVVERAGLTRGALYYHFKDKAEMFEAVVQEIVLDTRARVNKRVKGINNPWHRLITGCETYLDLCMEPTYQRIVLRESLAVIEWERLQEIMNGGESDIINGVRRSMKVGYLPSGDPNVIGVMLSGACREAAFVLANAKNRTAARAEVGDVLRRMFDGLKSPDAPKE